MRDLGMIPRRKIHIRKWLDSKPGFTKILKNTAWLYGDNAIRMATGLVVTAWLARYLGPQQFGLYNFSLALVGLSSPIAALGLSNILVRELVKKPERRDVYLGTAAVLHLVAGVLAYSVALIAVYLVRPEESHAQMAVSVVGLTLMFTFKNTISCFNEANVMSKYTVIPMNVAFATASLVKVIFIVIKAPLLFFLILVPIEVCIGSVLLFYAYHRSGGRIVHWRMNVGVAKDLLQSSWPLLLSAFSALIYMSSDKVMIGILIGDTATGLYSAATTISTIWYFIPSAILASVFPYLLRDRGGNQALYMNRMQMLFDFLVVLSASMACFIFIFSKPLIDMLYANEFKGASSIVDIHIWTFVFATMSVTSYQWLLAENLQILSFQRAAISAILNIALNLVLIPAIGVNGAAIGTLISYAFGALLFDLLQEKTRPIFWMKVAALNPVGVVRMVRHGYR